MRGTLTLSNTTFNKNTAYLGYGGALQIISGATATITNSVFYDNLATIHGGGALASFGNLSLTNVTFAGNACEYWDCAGGAIYLGSPTATNAINAITVVDNVTDAQVDGGGIYFNDNVTASVTNSIFAHNTGHTNATNDCAIRTTATLTGNHNIIQHLNPDCASLNAAALDPLVAALANNGGSAPTAALLATSPAIAAGDPATCPATDARGVARPSGAACDLGAYQRNAQGMQLSSATAPAAVAAGETVLATFTVNNLDVADALNAALTLPVPAHATFASASTSLGSCALGGALVTCTLGTLAINGSAHISIAFRPSDEGAVGGTATLIADNLLSALTADWGATASASADVAVTQSYSPSPAVQAQKVTLTVTVTDNGPTAAHGVVLTESVAGGVTVVSATASQGTCASNICTLGDLSAGAVATVMFVLSAPPTTAAATLSTTSADAVAANNLSTLTLATVTASEAAKAASSAAPKKGCHATSADASVGAALALVVWLRRRRGHTGVSSKPRFCSAPHATCRSRRKA